MAKPVQLDTTLTEFTYTIAREAPLSVKRLLPLKLYRAINTEKGAMRFASRSTFEEKREFFSYLGIEHFSIFVDMKRGAINDFRHVFKDLDPEEKPTETLKKLIEANVYVSSNKEFCYLLGHASQLTDTSAYSRNMELVRTSYHIKKFKSKIFTEEHKEAVERNQASAHLAKVIHGILWATDLCEEVTQINVDTFRLLLYFYIHRQLYISHEALLDIFAGAISGRTVTSSRRKLLSQLYIQRHPSQKRNEYTITARGVLIVNKFIDKVMKSFDF